MKGAGICSLYRGFHCIEVHYIKARVYIVIVDTLFLQNFITLFAGFAICKISFGIGKMSGFKWLWSRTNVAFGTGLRCHWRRFGYGFGCHSRTDCQTTQTEKASQEQNSLKKKKKKIIIISNRKEQKTKERKRKTILLLFKRKFHVVFSLYCSNNKKRI